MCGRFALTAPASAITEIFEVDVLPNILPRYNIAPSQDIPAILLEDGIRTAKMLKWGLIPFWAKDRKIAYRTTNARSETAAKKPSFRSSFKKRRCLLVANGYYEWLKRSKTDKVPHLLEIDDGAVFAMAGLWSSWTDPETGEDVLTASILTTEANDTITHIHNRMPVVLEPDDFDTWLSPETPPEQLQELMRPLPGDRMRFRAVSKVVGNARNQGEQCQAPFDEPEE